VLSRDTMETWRYNVPYFTTRSLRAASAVEDTEITYEQLESIFGVKVADGVLALSKDRSLEKSLQLADSLHRIKQQPQDVWIVKLADRISNLQPPPPHWTKAKMIHYRDEAIDIHTALKDASPFLSLRLSKKIANYLD
jgi:(p)ppGpp synthase/HD superfamily hydrolase